MHIKTWNSILSHISRSIDAHRFETWFRPLSLVETTVRDTILIAAPNQFIADFLEQHYKKTLLSTALQFNPEIKNFSFCVKESADKSLFVTHTKVEHDLKQQPSPSSRSYPQLNRRFSLDKFVVGPNNEFARSAALAVAEAPGTTKFNPLLIYGGVGLGKTHLLQSIGNYILSTSKSLIACQPHNAPKH